MKLEAIFALWEEDSKIDRTCLDTESLRIAELHHKYYKIYTNERLLLRDLESQLKVLKLEKQEFYTQGPTKETQEKGWKLPPIGKILRQDVASYIDADPDIIKLALKIGIQHEKISLLESIIDLISKRGFQIKNAIDYLKFTNGVL